MKDTMILNIQIQRDGKLKIFREEKTAVFDFNANYKGYYPFCRWTAAGRGELMYLAGVDQEGIPHLFSSAGGETWTENNIRTRIGIPDPRDYGDIIHILYEERDRQLFLVSKNGFLVTLPDCPKCVRARLVSEHKLTDAKMGEGYLLLTDEYGEQIRIPTGTAAQYRCAWSFAKPFLEDGGLLFDLRSSREEIKMPVSSAIRMDINDLDGLLGRMPKSRPMFFFCSHGYLADQAARDARGAGFERSYSLGSLFDMMQDLEEV